MTNQSTLNTQIDMCNTSGTTTETQAKLLRALRNYRQYSVQEVEKLAKQALINMGYTEEIAYTSSKNFVHKFCKKQ